MPRRTAIDAAFERMLAADDAKHASGSNHDWSAWQQAATDYWVLFIRISRDFVEGTQTRP
jgi:hypothetical protein